jgi:hypothetical protein
MASHVSFHTTPPSPCRHPTQNNNDKKKAPRTVHFAASTVDVLAALAHRRHSQLPRHPTLNTQAHCKPILKDSESSMTAYLRKTGEHFSKALHAFGRWCHGVTSKNANVRSDMYKTLIAQIRGASQQMQRAAGKVLHENVHGFWVSLVDDFNIIREEPSEQQLVL